MNTTESMQNLIEGSKESLPDALSNDPLDKPLSSIEKTFLLHAERGDCATVRNIIQEYRKNPAEFDINCVDPLNRSALISAIENENIELIRLLLEEGIKVKDGLLHAIKEEYVEAVEVLLNWEEDHHIPGELYSWEKIDRSSASFTADITPLILAAHKNNYEIIKLLLDRGATLPMPHDVRCGCDECVFASKADSLRYSQSRINAYRALSSPSLISLSSNDPLLTAFELSWDLRRLSRMETEFRTEYIDMRNQVQTFATSLLDHARTSNEIEIMLNYDPDGDIWVSGERQTLERLKLAIKYKQKAFVAHPNVQQLLASIWYEGLPGFRRKNMIGQGIQVAKIGMMFPLYCTIHIMAPNSKLGMFMKKPFVKFICHSASYGFFLMLLGAASQRVEILALEMLGTAWVQEIIREWKRKERGALFGVAECGVILYVIGLIWAEIRALWCDGLEEYISDLWNIVDFITNVFYVIWLALRVTSFYITWRDEKMGKHTWYPREEWSSFEPMLLSEGAFAAGMIFSFLKLVHIFSVNPHLGPLQISLGRMIIDIIKFFFIYTLVLFAFGCGLNQLLWYYSELEKNKCYHTPDGLPDFDNNDKACEIWRRYANLFETSQSLFWASFGLVDLMAFELTGIKSFTRFWALLMFGSYSVINIIVLLNMLIAMMSNSYQIISDMMTQLKRTSIRNQVEEYLFETSQSLFWASFGLIDIISFELTGIKSFTRFWALLMFGSYSVINIIVLLNMLIAMMSNSYQIISERSDTEWKFARSRLWINYFDEDDPLPAPFNMLPTQDMLGCKKNKISTKSFKEKSKDKAREKHEAVMRLLVRRYVTAEQRKRDDYGITEDDVMEIRQDISSLRYELIDILRKNGMQTPEIKYQDVQLSGKKGKVMERRLLKDFHIGIVEGLVQEMSQNTEPKNIFGQLAKVIGRRTTSKSKKKDWNALVRKSSVKSDPIGSQQGMENSIAKRQSLRKHILTNVTQLQNLDDTMLIEYNPLLSEVPRGARVAWAKFMTKKITVDYNQETMNSNVANEQPKREPKALKEKQHSLISLRSQASQKSQDQLSIKSLTQKIAEKNPVDEPKPVLENTSERLENPDTFTNECRSKCLSPLLETNSPVESRATTPQDLERTDLQNDNVQEGQEEMKELPEKKVEKNDDTMQKNTEKKSEGKSIKEKSSISKKPKDETKDSSASASEKDNEPPVIPPTQRSKLTGKTRTGWI